MTCVWSHKKFSMNFSIAAWFLGVKKQTKPDVHQLINDWTRAVCPYNELWFSNNKKRSMNSCYMDQGWKHYAKSKKKKKGMKGQPHIVWFHLYQVSKISKPIQTENRWVVSKGSEEEEIRSDFLLGWWNCLGFIKWCYTTCSSLKTTELHALKAWISQ